MRSGTYYVVKTDLDPTQLNRVGLHIFALWLDFALGNSVLNGRRIVYPTGKYAASLSFRQVGESAVAVVADEDIAPEAAVLESGHGPVDLKTRLAHGRAYPMHRPVGGNQAATGVRRVGSGPPGLRPSVWAEVRGREASGFASIGPNSPPDSWIIPPMTAYSPAATLARMASTIARGAT